MFAIMGDVSGGVVDVVQKALSQPRHAKSGLLVIPDRPPLSIAPKATVTTHEVSAHRDSRKGKLLRWLIEDPSSPARALDHDQMVSSTVRGYRVYLTRICPIDLVAFKRQVSETSLPDSLHLVMSVDAWEDAKKTFLLELTVQTR